jgi:hypothetical protein
MRKRLLYTTLTAVHYARGESNGKQSEDAFGTADAAWKDG